jgi:hypothetical protein
MAGILGAGAPAPYYGRQWRTHDRDRTSGIITASPEKLYAAFIDPVALLARLPPAPTTGRLHAFDAQPGGGYRLSLFYPRDEPRFAGARLDDPARQHQLDEAHLDAILMLAGLPP